MTNIADQNTFFDYSRQSIMTVSDLIEKLMFHTIDDRCEVLEVGNYNNVSSLNYVYKQNDKVKDKWLFPFKIVEIEDSKDVALEFVPVDIVRENDHIIIRHANISDRNHRYDGLITPERMLKELIKYNNSSLVKFRERNNDGSFCDHMIIDSKPIGIEGGEEYFLTLKFETM